MDGVHLLGRPGHREAHPPAPVAQDGAVQRRARVPAVRVPHGGRRQPPQVTFETLLRLALVPAAVWVASLAARRWGHAVSGYLGGLPMIGGPITLYLALDYGPRFAARSATFTLAVILGQAAHLLAFSHAGRFARWPLALAAGWASFLAVALVVVRFDPAPAMALALA